MNVRLALLALAIFTNSALGLDRSFWVWNRTEPLSSSEKASLQALGVETLYWELGELANTTGHWSWKRPPMASLPAAAPFQVIPVIRLESSVKAPFENPVALAAMIQSVVSEGAELQIDYDAPDRLLVDYADFLRLLKERYPRISASALAGWVDHPAFPRLQSSVAELFPMFYDLQTDTGLHPLPMLEPESTMTRIRIWEKACRIPWHVGLPTFARLSIYEPSGALRGHIPQWSWDDVCFNRQLRLVRVSAQGVTILQAVAATSIGRYSVAEGQLVVARWPDRAALAAVEKDLSHSIIYFRLPEDSAAGGWTMDQLSQLGSDRPPRLFLQRDSSGGLQLVNDSPVDLAPRLAGQDEWDRGYALEIDGQAPIFRDIEPGDFWRLAAHRDPESHPVASPVALATRLTFWFSNLPARHHLAIRIFQLAPHADLSQLRYRVLLGPSSTEGWQRIAPSSE
ncbi:hypothetical protein BH09VER1_BH09VER1_01780 [soil metagenome]